MLLTNMCYHDRTRSLKLNACALIKNMLQISFSVIQQKVRSVEY